MAGTDRINWAIEDKADALILLERNEGNLHQTAREFTEMMRGKYPQLSAGKTVQRAVIRNWRDAQSDPDATDYNPKLADLMQARLSDAVVPAYDRLIDKCTAVIERGVDQLLDAPKISATDMFRVNGIRGTLVTERNLLQGKATSIHEERVVHDKDTMQDAFAGALRDVMASRDVAAARSSQAQRYSVDGECTEEPVPELGTSTETVV